MKRYLDPKNDYVFKCVFGKHPDLLLSFLNALMPFEPDRRIESLEYIPNEMVPENPAKKHSVVDVRCKDNYGRHFIVEMQMDWSDAFPSRMLFNASKAYVQQLKRKEYYDELQPVYALGILNENYDRKTEEFYHRYQFVNRKHPDDVIKGMEVILIELPKFRIESWVDRKMSVLWLRFLREVREGVEISADLLENEIIRQALDICEESAFTDEELAIYDKYWDDIRTQKTLLREREAKGRAEGKEEGREEGREESLTNVVRNSKLNGLSLEQIQAITGLAEDRILEILRS
ncbi:MAG: Rpn family recombination-promoting nuclease/putative transposase [Tannerella sp.]|jgi:predicted transposase/invertase (TIGR01784 family)|nr:Rpn family recombination-promoting nuclease/putative transposase [Tannerella sp.]